MRLLPSLFLALPLLVAGCGPSKYAYVFDLTDPGAQNRNVPGEADTISDQDVTAEILMDPTNFQAVLLELTNKTNQPIEVNWNQVGVVMPDGTEMPLHPDSSVGPIQPGVKLVVRLVPFRLPSNRAAGVYNGQVFQLLLPMLVRGTAREYRFHLVAHLRGD